MSSKVYFERHIIVAVLEVLEERRLIMSQLCALAVMMANGNLGCSSRNRAKRLSKVTIPLYSALVGPQ